MHCSRREIARRIRFRRSRDLIPRANPTFRAPKLSDLRAAMLACSRRAEGRPGSCNPLARFGIAREEGSFVLDPKSRVESVFGGPGTSFLEANPLRFRRIEPRSSAAQLEMYKQTLSDIDNNPTNTWWDNWVINPFAKANVEFPEGANYQLLQQLGDMAQEGRITPDQMQGVMDATGLRLGRDPRYRAYGSAADFVERMQDPKLLEEDARSAWQKRYNPDRRFAEPHGVRRDREAAEREELSRQRDLDRIEKTKLEQESNQIKAQAE